jgi:hypothetical protein
MVFWAIPVGSHLGRYHTSKWRGRQHIPLKPWLHANATQKTTIWTHTALKVIAEMKVLVLLSCTEKPLEAVAVSGYKNSANITQ